MFPLLLCTTKLAQRTSQYYCVLKSLHKTFPVLLCSTKLAQTRSSTTVYNKACTKHSQQSRSQYYCVLQSLHKHVPVLLCTTKLAQTPSSTTVYYKACTSTFQYYCVLQSLHKALPSTTVYYKAYTNKFRYYCVLQSLHKHVPVLLCTTCSFPYRHGDIQGAKDTRCCSFPYRQRTNNVKNEAKNEAPTNWRRTRAQPPDPQTINGNRPSLRIREKYKFEAFLRNCS